MYVYRETHNKKFKYYDKNGKKVTNKKIIAYIQNIKIPPAYEDVEINLNPNAKLLVTGYDDAGRKQYMYNKKWVAMRSKEKYCNLIGFGKKLPQIKRQISTYMMQKKIDKNKIIALILTIILICNFRIGNVSCRDKYNSFGISTITKKHVNFKNNNTTVIDFIGKKGVRNTCTIHNKKITDTLAQLYKKRTKNESLFTYSNGNRESTVTSSDINDFLKQYGDYTSKDFRTWIANTDFINEIMDIGFPISNTITERKKAVLESIKIVAADLHHTVAVCRKKYILSDLSDLYIDNPKKFKKLVKDNYKRNGQLDASSNAFIKFLQTYCKCN